MNQMAKPKGLALRGAVYYSRVIVPKMLIPRFGRKQIWKSLGTSDKDEAEALHLKEAAHWKAAFVEAGKPEPRRKSSKLAKADVVLTDADAARLARRFFDRARADLDRGSLSSADVDEDERERVVEDLQAQLSSLTTWRNPDAHMQVGEAATQALEGSGVSLGWNTASSQLLAEYLRRALIQLHSIELARLLGDYRGQLAIDYCLQARGKNFDPPFSALDKDGVASGWHIMRVLLKTAR